MTDLFLLRGIPAYVWSDNSPEFVAEAVWQWTAGIGGKLESLNLQFRDEFLDEVDL